MSTAAAPARGFQTARPLQNRGWRERLYRGWTETPHILPQRLFQILTPVEVCIVWNIWDQTMDGDRPEGSWAMIKQVEFAEWANVEERHVCDALSRLTAIDGPVEVEVVGSQRRYRIHLKRLLAMQTREKRKLQRVEKPVTVSHRASTTVRPGVTVPLQFEKPTRTISFKSSDNSNYTIQTEVMSDRVEVEITSESIPPTAKGAAEGQGNTPKRDPGRPDNSQAKSEDRANESSTGVQVFSYAELVEALKPWFHDLFKEPLDYGRIRQVYDKIGRATLPDFISLCARRSRRKGFSPALLPILAGQAAQLAAERAVSAPKPPPPAGPAFIPDGDDSSPWAKVRALLKERIAPQEYENWVRRTRFVRVDEVDRQMVVAVPDRVTADFIDQEYLHLIRRALDETDQYDVAGVRWDLP